MKNNWLREKWPRIVEDGLAERVKTWTEEWKQQGLQEGWQQGLQQGRQ
jgi:flagellar biosynthesis/type III secretory pathway protein FliH